MKDERIPWEKFRYYLNNSEAAIDDDFNAWLNCKEANRVFWEETKLMYSITGKLPGLFEPNRRKAWSKINHRISFKGRSIFKNQFFMRVAASIILVLIGATTMWFLSPHLNSPIYAEVYSPFGHKTLVVLPDSSKVWLNGNSRLRYEASFARSRNVELSGEALFDVMEDKRKVFSVKTDDFKVEVYGTRFNMKSYPDEINTEVALIEGSVGLYSKNQFLNKISPGEVASFDTEQNRLKVFRKDMDQIISWSTDELIIKNEKFEDVLNYLERWFGVDIITEDDLVINQRLSFKVKTESLQELLSIIDRISPIDYKIDGKDVIISRK